MDTIIRGTKDSARKPPIASKLRWLSVCPLIFSLFLILGGGEKSLRVLAQQTIPNEANAIFEDSETNEEIEEESNSVDLIVEPSEQAFITLFKRDLEIDPQNLSSTQDDLITYRLDLAVSETSPQENVTPTALEGTNILLNGTSQERIIVADVIPNGTTLKEDFTPETPSGWEVVYATDNPETTIPINTTETNAFAAANWTTERPPVAEITRIGFIFEGTLSPGTTTENTDTGFTFQVVSNQLPPEGGTVENIAQSFGETLDDPDDEIVYDESGDDQPNNFNDDNTPGVSFDPTDDTGIPKEDQGGETNEITITPSGAILTGPQNEPNAINTDNNDDFSNVSTPLTTVIPDEPFNPETVTLTNTVLNSGNIGLNDVVLIPVSPEIANELTGTTGRFGEDTEQNLGELPEGTIVEIQLGNQSASYQYNPTNGEFELIAGTTINLENLNANETEDYEVTIDLPEETNPLTGFSVPILAFVDENGNNQIDQASEETFNLTINRAYTGFLALKKEIRLLNENEEEIFGFTETPPSDLTLIPNQIIEYRISYENLATLPEGNNAEGNQQLTADNLVITEDGNGEGSNWGTNTNHLQNTIATTGTIEFFDEENSSLGTTDPPENTPVTRYVNEVGTLNPEESGSLEFQREIVTVPSDGGIQNQAEISLTDANGDPIVFRTETSTLEGELLRQAFKKVIKNSTVDPQNLSSTQDDLITYRLDLAVADTSPQENVIATALEGTNILLNGTSQERIIVADAIPNGTTLEADFTPETPSGWEVVYATDNPETTIPINTTETNALAAANWTTERPPVAEITRIGFIFEGTLSPGTTTETTDTGFTFQVVSNQLPPEGGTVENIAQSFGETLDDPDNEIVYDESGDDQPNNFNDDNTPGDDFDPTDDTGVIDDDGDEQGEIDRITIELSDPFAGVVGCDATPLDNYNGFTIGLYRPDPNIPGAVQGLLPLTMTNPDFGLPPNVENNNPFSLEPQGQYNFLLTEEQITPESTYVLIVNPPDNSSFGERRIQVRFGSATNNQIPFTATALDGLPIDFTTGNPQTSGTVSQVVGNDLEQLGLAIALSLNIGICDQESIRITKSSDRASASPGEVAVYRLRVENLATGELDDITITDTLPMGFQILPDSIQGELAGEEVTLEIDQDQQNLIIELDQPFPEDEILNIAYATEITADALRGDGKNAANVTGNDPRNGLPVEDGPAIHEMRVTGGLVSDAGTIIGRVFVDKNFDGEQQPGEPGVPNAVIILDDGTEVTTDADGLFSITNVLPGPRTGVLDLTSLEGYTLAPNQYFIERNSQSRLVNLSPGGTVRMNFAVTPVYNQSEEEESQP